MQDNQLLLYVVVGAFAAALFLSLYRRREYYSYKLNLLLRMVLAYGVGIAIAVGLFHQQGFSPIVWGWLAGLLVFIGTKPRGRNFSASTKRRARAEFELRTGKKFNSRKHEYDHVVPHSRGGGSTADNIRVVEKKSNRSKGAKSPWWDLLGR